MKRLVVLPILACTAGFADEEMNSFDQRLTALEQKMEDSKRPGRPSVCHWTDAGYHVTVAAGPIFWKAREDDLDFAIRSELGLAQNARTIRPNFDWDWGAKVALGYQVPKYKMDINLNWTYLKTHAHRHISTEAPASLLSVWSLPSIGLGAANNARSKWKMNLNLVNLEVGGQFFPRVWLKLRPYFGLGTGWIDQKYDVELSGVTYSLDDIKMRNRFWGIGPRFGLDTSFGCGQGISVYGNAAVEILYGFFKTRQAETVTIIAFPTINFLNERDNFRTSRTILDLSMGLRWDRMFKDNRFHLGLQLGWDNLILYKQNQLKRFVDDIDQGVYVTMDGDLTVQGVSLKVLFGF